MTNNWRDEYMASLKQTEGSNPANMELMDICTKLADQVAALETEKALLEKTQAAPPTTPSKGKAPAEPSDNVTIAQLQRDLAEALRSQTAWETRARAAETENAKLKEKVRTQATQIRDLTAEKKVLTTKLNDRNDELRRKNKFATDLQDEMVALNMQVNVAESERDKVKKERQELIDRWMKIKGAEADKMNRANEASALFEKSR